MKQELKEEVVKQFWKSIYVVLRDRYAVKGGIVIPNFCSIKPNESGIAKRKMDPTRMESYRLFLEDWEKNVQGMKRKRRGKSEVEILDKNDVILTYGSLEGWLLNSEGKYERIVKRTKKRNQDDVQ